MQSFFRVFAACLVGSALAAPAAAQDAPPHPVRLSFEQPVGATAYRGIATINPFAVILGGFNGDVELNIGTGMTGALSATWFPDELDYTSVDLTFRYYPGELNPEGFSIGASVGYMSIEDDDPSDAGKGAAIGFIGGYSWLLGKSNRLAIATGLGAKRLLSNSGPEATLTGRLGVGLAF